MLFDQDELEALLKQGRVGGMNETPIKKPEAIELHQKLEIAAGVVDISSQRVYHRNVRYR